MKAAFFFRTYVFWNTILLVGFCLLWMIGPSQVFGQVASPDNAFLTDKKVEVGVNITTVLFSALGNSNNSLDPGRFPWTAKVLLNPTHAVRFGIGANLQQQAFTSQGRLRSFNHFLSFRMGYEWRIPIERRWMAYWGIDGLIDYRNEQVVNRAGNDFVILKLESIGAGGGPIMGLQFAVADRVIVGSEASFYGVYHEVRRQEQFRNFPDENTNAVANSIEVSLSVPRWLYVSIRL